jgi:DNA-directed RNA polymerase specialized sigma subunit
MWNKFKRFHQYDELLSIAYLASVEAERTYDASKAKFSAYVTPRIEGSITRAVSNLTSSQHKDLKGIYAFIDNYIETHNRIPAQHIILKHLKMSETKFIHLLDTAGSNRYIPIEDVTEEQDNSIDLDTLAEVDQVMCILRTLPEREQKRIQHFLDDPNVSEQYIESAIISIRKKLKIQIPEEV